MSCYSLYCTLKFLEVLLIISPAPVTSLLVVVTAPPPPRVPPPLQSASAPFPVAFPSPRVFLQGPPFLSFGECIQPFLSLASPFYFLTHISNQQIKSSHLNSVLLRKGKEEGEVVNITKRWSPPGGSTVSSVAQFSSSCRTKRLLQDACYPSPISQ